MADQPWLKYQTPAAPPRGGLFTLPPNPKDVRTEARADEDQALQRRNDERAARSDARSQAEFDLKNNGITPPGNLELTGEEYLKTLPKGIAAQVRAMADGRRGIPANPRGREMMTLVAAANQFDPTLDAANSATRVKTRANFTSGKARQNMTAINTALGHLGTLWDRAQKLENRSVPAWNAVANKWETETGDKRVKDFDFAKQAVVDEITRVFKGSGGNLTEVLEWQKQLSPNSSPEQLRGVVGTAVELLHSRLEALGQEYSGGMGRSADPVEFLTPHSQKVFDALGPGGDGNVPPPPKKGDGPPPILVGDATPPAGPRSLDGLTGPPKVGPADYSGMVGGPAQTLATADGVLNQTYRNQYDPVAAGGVAALIRKAKPYQMAVDYAVSHDLPPPNEDAYNAAVKFAADHHGATNVEASHSVPTTLGQRLASSAPAAAIAGSSAGATAGLSDVLGRTLAGPAWDANRAALSGTHGTADFLGNLAGGAGAMYFGGGLLSNALERGGAGSLAKRALAFKAKNPILSTALADAGYGGTYGASENPDDPLGGAWKGAATAALGGQAARSGIKAAGRMIAPVGGAASPLYEAGVTPTLGQRAAAGGSWLGRAVNATEQAAQSVPLLGGLIAGARGGARAQFQRGGFNSALEHIGQQLPDDVPIGSAAQAHAAKEIGGHYDAARTGMQFTPTEKYAQEFGQWQQNLHNGTLDGKQVEQVQNKIAHAVGTRMSKNPGAPMSGDAYKAAASDLGEAAHTWSKSPDKAAMAPVLRDYATIFDNAARETSHPQAVAMLDNADAAYAKLVRLQRAGELGGVVKDTGTFTPTSLLQAVKQSGGGVRSSSYLRGKGLMQDYAEAGRSLIDTVPNSGSAERLFTGQALVGGGAASLGAPLSALVSPWTLGAFAPYLGNIGGKALAPRSSEILKRLGQNVYGRADAFGRVAAPAALGYFPPE